MSIFSKIPVQKTKRSLFNLSYQNAFTSTFGKITPVYIEDCIPGDIFNLAGLPYIVANPLSAPILGTIKADTYYFFVPKSLVWENWEKFITGGPDGTASPAMPYKLPLSTSSTYLELFDYLSKSRSRTASSGSIVKGTIHPKVNMLDWRAYWLIYNSYFRDENLEQDLFDDKNSNYISLGDGDITTLPGYSQTIDGKDLFQLPYASWKKDLFTSALPWTQRGPSVAIPISGDLLFKEAQSGTTVPVGGYGTSLSNVPANVVAPIVTQNVQGKSGKLLFENSAESFTIEDLRYASALQRWLERNAVGGGRYVEQILSHYGCVIPDYRAFRPEFIGGVSTAIMSGTVYQNSATTDQSVLGTRGGQASGSGVMKSTKYKCRDHGYIIGVQVIRPSEGFYSEGINRRSLKFDKFDIAFPEFQNLGEQEILNAEIFTDGRVESSNDGKVFGYGPRYYEYKHRQNEVHGDFRTSLAYWIPQRIFGDLPGLNQDFVHVNPNKEKSLNNIFAVTDGNKDQFMCVHSTYAKVIRPLSKYTQFKLF
ncbi:major capsid protein [Sigmofec virus UA08Rod_6404]|uniref:Major capsid protein n=1 Tax=Sigmofec virus UA08Rod_6404 TaxID=2929229 RepID=A0A976N0Z9_9VIRU|nr:major capsid protein [Sigmofec virus UA08Rod_6404]